MIKQVFTLAEVLITLGIVGIATHFIPEKLAQHY